MKFQEFCMKLLSFPLLAKLSGWKHHCTEYTQTPFPIITLPGGTFYPTTASSTFTFAPTNQLQTTTTASTIKSTLSETTTMPLLTTTETVELTTTESKTKPIISTEPPPLTTTALTSEKTTESPPMLTTTDLITTTTFSTNYPVLTTTEDVPILTTTEDIPDTTYPILTTTKTDSTIVISTENLLPPPLTTTEFYTIKPVDPPVLTTTEQVPETIQNVPVLTTTEIPSTIVISTEKFSPPQLTTTESYTLPPFDPPELTTTEEVPTRSTTTTSTTRTTTKITTKTPNQTDSPPPLTTTISELINSTIPNESNLTSTVSSFTSIPTTSEPPSITESSPIPSTILTILSTSTIPAPGQTTCPPFPTICNPPSGGNFGENAIDPRQDLRTKRQAVSQACLSPDGASGNCVNFRKCSFIVNLIVQLQQRQDDGILNYLKKAVCGQDGQDPLVCCPSLVFASLTGTTTAPSTIPQPGSFVFSSITTPRSPINLVSPSPPIPSPPPPTSPPSSSGGLVFGPVNSQPSSTNAPSTSASPIVNTLPTNEANKCGMVYALRSRIVGGQSASPGSYPWLAALGYNITNTTTKISTIQFLCASTLITQRHLLSAAHCIIPTLLLARLGAYDITQPADGVNTIDAFVTNNYVHELYNSQKITFDISVIKLDRVIPITNYIRPACIPLTDNLKYKDYTGVFGWIAGWGSTSFGGPASQTLQEVQLPVVALADCAFNYKLYFPNQVFDNNILCAGYTQGGKDSCQGDSGGGFVVQQLSADGTYYYYNVLGVVSYGYECARPGFPGIYTRVTQYISWIQSKITL